MAFDWITCLLGTWHHHEASILTLRAQRGRSRRATSRAERSEKDQAERAASREAKLKYLENRSSLS